MTDSPVILLAGASGNLGGRIANALVSRGASVRALVRPSTSAAKRNLLIGMGASIVETDFTDRPALQRACRNVDCVVSALQGLREVIIDYQGRLLDAAIAAGVSRFIPSDFSIDFAQLGEGTNRNLDLRREFHDRLIHARIASTGIYIGALADVLAHNVWLLNLNDRTVGYWDDPDWKLDFTTIEDAASFTAEAALDASSPSALRFASFQQSPRCIADAASRVFGLHFHLLRLGSRDELAARNRELRMANPEGEREVYPIWQQGQYMQSMFATRHASLDNQRYPSVMPASLSTWLSELRGRQLSIDAPG